MKLQTWNEQFIQSIYYKKWQLKKELWSNCYLVWQPLFGNALDSKRPHLKSLKDDYRKENILLKIQHFV